MRPWFKHPAGASYTDEVLQLRHIHGLIALAVYWGVTERIAQSEECQIPYSPLLFSILLSICQEDIEKIMETAIGLELFKVKNGSLRSTLLDQVNESYETKCEKLRANARLGGIAKGKNSKKRLREKNKLVANAKQGIANAKDKIANAKHLQAIAKQSLSNASYSLSYSNGTTDEVKDTEEVGSGTRAPEEPQDSPIISGCKYFRLNDHELELAHAWYPKHDYPIELIKFSIQAVDSWLLTDKPAAVKARESRSHYAYLHQGWVLEEGQRLMGIAQRSRPRNVQNSPKNSSFEANMRLVDSLRESPTPVGFLTAFDRSKLP